ncbi:MULTISPECIES: tryptophan synthase subunit alpha [Actinomadura]|uniref:Tryptophan synthase alpha chain n=1 Tax=Actinomadura yumaensis TaxID=111807 RepID=A0ABW2CCY8_9ACTN|nr:tryptophan synthase subunit alpha [Actinomadura sp. J1-007]MWK35660.1 tryptophan synthase subunit alpha [Actinomadura sp. J1-007]
MNLETHLRARRDAGHKLLVPYVTGGLSSRWPDYITAFEAAGADAVEIGLPFSDPMLDGATIQEASDRALARGATARGILEELARLRANVPLVAMTYLNLVVQEGPDAFCAALREAGVAGLVVPDAPLEEAAGLEAASVRNGIDLVLLAAPSSSPNRLAEIADRSRGFVYAVSLMGTTGERTDLAESAAKLSLAIKAVTDRPTLLGFGVSTPAHAVEAARWADGVVIASALMCRALDGVPPEGLAPDVAAVRRALDDTARSCH